MIMKLKNRIVLLALITLVLSINGFAQKAGIKSISEQDLKAHMSFLSSDLLQGRNLGTVVPGLNIAAEYIRTEAELIGLKPFDQNYFQAVNLLSVAPDPKSSFLEVTDDQGNQKFKDDSVYTFSSGPNDLLLSGKLIFAGYGWTNTSTGYDDFDGVDLKDKLVLMMTRNPELVMNPQARTSDTGRRGRFGGNSDFGKVSNAIQKGAKAVLIVTDPMDPSGGMFSMIRGFGSRGSYQLEGVLSESRRPGGGSNMFFVASSTANSILALAGKSLKGLQDQINQSGKPASFELTNMNVKIQLNKVKKTVETKNIIGIVEGSDPVLKNECIVYMAHYDHLGIGENGDVYNGADDNASGVAGLLEIAKAFSKLDKKPRRSIVFAWVTGEEIGLFGSQYYTTHPIFPLDKTLACLNLDMIGRVRAEGDTAKYVRGEKNLIDRNGVYVITGRRSSELDSLNSRLCSEMGLKSDGSMSEAYISRSDYYHFHRNGIPILGYSTGVHTDYHRVTDEISKIDFPKMKVVTELAFRVGYEVANKKERIVVDKPLEKK